MSRTHRKRGSRRGFHGIEEVVPRNRHTRAAEKQRIHRAEAIMSKQEPVKRAEHVLIETGLAPSPLKSLEQVNANAARLLASGFVVPMLRDIPTKFVEEQLLLPAPSGSQNEKVYIKNVRCNGSGSVGEENFSMVLSDGREVKRGLWLRMTADERRDFLNPSDDDKGFVCPNWLA